MWTLFSWQKYLPLPLFLKLDCRKEEYYCMKTFKLLFEVIWVLKDPKERHCSNCYYTACIRRIWKVTENLGSSNLLSRYYDINFYVLDNKTRTFRKIKSSINTEIHLLSCRATTTHLNSMSWTCHQASSQSLLHSFLRIYTVFLMYVYTCWMNLPPNSECSIWKQRQVEQQVLAGGFIGCSACCEWWLFRLHWNLQVVM